ncbi:MAG: glycosyltransferase family 2 protein [Flavobacteriaceae bacterium]|nr:glycosyltransferase family 2 protein [Flavobacteriaceae bacterium]
MEREIYPKIEISVVIPIFNEEQIIEELTQRLESSVSEITEKFELIFVNDGSSDASLSKLIDLSNTKENVYYINLSRNFGHQKAVCAGLDHVRGKVVVVIDGDLQDPPELIPKLYKKYLEGYEVVYAQRTSRKGESYFKKWSAKVFYRTLDRLTSIKIPLDTGDFRLMDRKVVDYLTKMPEQNKFLRGQIAWLGFRQTSVPFQRNERKLGETGYPFSKMLSFALDGITGFSNVPLSLVTRAGFVISAAASLIILYAMFSHFVLGNTVTGWTSLIISFLFIGGIQLISVGVIGEYIGRIHTNTQKRPLYIVASTNCKKFKNEKRKPNLVNSNVARPINPINGDLSNQLTG